MPRGRNGREGGDVKVFISGTAKPSYEGLTGLRVCLCSMWTEIRPIQALKIGHWSTGMLEEKVEKWDNGVRLRASAFDIHVFTLWHMASHGRLCQEVFVL